MIDKVGFIKVLQDFYDNEQIYDQALDDVKNEIHEFYIMIGRNEVDSILKVFNRDLDLDKSKILKKIEGMSFTTKASKLEHVRSLIRSELSNQLK